MADRIVIVRVGAYLLSLPFAQIDEILGPDRAVTGSGVPEEVLSRDPSATRWISSRRRWLPVGKILPGQESGDAAQIVVVRGGGTGRAFMVDQVLGIESAGAISPFPDAARPYTDIPFAGVRFWKDRPVLELDLSGLISLDRGNRRIG
ncbi:MAG: chemotaxis protein CheW [bacterium]|nr:MAG: chemotaxis protein CheW [bacterium]